ncbi:hypothetical protein B0T17DRAFT_611933 [Bombardia bombarda]|uniref:Uncharacterized protein n=1 Tax=Bombardia bombarda TaxID=252184 RepID=A0AA40CDP6_9PEZI|nr:hypothetical protein B0T17DRAFT_611933 [Bombardia bombarda]
MPRKNASPPEKRRAPLGSASPSRATRGSNSSSSTTPSARNTSGGSGGSVIAAPPRAARGGGASSPAPDDYRNNSNNNRDGTLLGPGSSRSESASNTSKDTAGDHAATAAATSAAATAAATARALKEKDARIAHLERELGIMETEFTRELDKLSTTESEVASFWQAKYSALNQQFLRSDTDVRLLRAEVELREAERGELRSGCEAARRDVRQRDDEIRSLRSQIHGLKEWVSTSTRSDGQAQTSDEVFGDGMTRLGNGLQNWVLVNFRRAKIDLPRPSESTISELGRLVPMYEDLVSTAKIHLLQSVVSRILTEIVFDAYFVGLSSDQAKQLAQVETFLNSFATSPEPINQWRSMTLGILKKEADQKLHRETSAVTEAVVSKVNSVLDAITDAKATDARDQGLRALVASSIELSRLLGVQRAIFKVTMPEILPHQRTMFDGSTMEDMGGEDEESLAEREICCVTFPGIIKKGDESGGHLQYRNVITKAQVLCSPE